MSDRINDAKAITTDVFGEDDLIRRTDAVEALAEWGISPLVLMPVPSAQQWIPCSERLPDEARHYLCSFEKPNRIDRIYVGLAYWTGGRWHGYVADAINAWQPLPEPYKEGEQP